MLQGHVQNPNKQFPAMKPMMHIATRLAAAAVAAATAIAAEASALNPGSVLTLVSGPYYSFQTSVCQYRMTKSHTSIMHISQTGNHSTEPGSTFQKKHLCVYSGAANQF